MLNKIATCLLLVMCFATPSFSTEKRNKPKDNQHKNQSGPSKQATIDFILDKIRNDQRYKYDSQCKWLIDKDLNLVRYQVTPDENNGAGIVIPIMELSSYDVHEGLTVGGERQLFVFMQCAVGVKCIHGNKIYNRDYSNNWDSFNLDLASRDTAISVSRALIHLKSLGQKKKDLF